MPTLVGMRRRGYTPQSIRLFTDRIGVSKSDSWIDMGLLEDCLRQDLNESAPRRIAVLRPLKLIIDNFPEGQVEECTAPNHPQNPEWGSRPVALSRVLYIEQEDFMEVPTKGYFRLSPGMEVRLRYAYIVKYVGLVKNDNGEIEEIHCTYDPDTKSGTPGAESRKVKGNIHWLSSLHACKSEVRIFDRLFVEPHPDSGGKDYKDSLNPHSRRSYRPILNPPSVTPYLKSYSSLNGMATSSLTGLNQSPEDRSSIARSRYGTPGESPADLRVPMNRYKTSQIPHFCMTISSLRS